MRPTTRPHTSNIHRRNKFMPSKITQYPDRTTQHPGHTIQHPDHTTQHYGANQVTKKSLQFDGGVEAM